MSACYHSAPQVKIGSRQFSAHGFCSHKEHTDSNSGHMTMGILTVEIDDSPVLSWFHFWDVEDKYLTIRARGSA